MEKNEFSKIEMLKKVLNILFKIIYNVLICFCILLIIIVVWQRATNSNKSFYGYKLFRIISGSMVPEYNIDEIVVCQDIDTKILEVGDVIVYRGRIGELNNKLVMHEIVGITESNNGLIFSVKGIQNITGDPNVSSGQILGKVVFKSQILTYIYSLATSAYSSFIIITILVINVFISFRPMKKETPKLAEHIEDDRKLEIQVEEKVLEDNTENNVQNNVQNRKYKLKNKEKSIKKIKENNDLKKEIEKNIFDKRCELEKNEESEKNINIKKHELEKIDNSERLQEENRKLQEENKLLKEKVEKLNKKNNNKDKN